MITLSNVGKSYGHDVTIGPVDLTIPEGGITALVGPNGAGKSTLLTMIGRLLGIDSGHIEVAGYDVAKTKSKDLAKIIAILRQENSLHRPPHGASARGVQPLPVFARSTDRSG